MVIDNLLTSVAAEDTGSCQRNRR